MPAHRAILEKYFVATHITVEEREEKKSSNTPGGDELEKRLGGPAGLPFYAFLNERGELIVNSLAKGGDNIGYPFEADEVDAFMQMLQKAAPRMSPKEQSVLQAWLKEQKK